MTTPPDLRKFATDCLLWAEGAKDAGQRDTLVRLARMWMQTASELDQVHNLNIHSAMRGSYNSTDV